jgi:hypothetical protein
MKTLRALIVDDEASARSRLARQLQECPQVTVEGEAENGLAAPNGSSNCSPMLSFSTSKCQG